MQNSFFLRMMVLVAVFTLFSPGKIYAAICQQRYPSDSEECHFVQSTERDAKRGDVSAQFSLGVAYFYGEGVPQDYLLVRQSRANRAVTTISANSRP
ncbi:TPA: sel1 repeat family protein [Salmonella enterica]|nr:sel1 repeat family protein [Salmonella enterica]HCL5278092.1 sel1 repeat family protein [Salmonella enterica]